MKMIVINYITHMQFWGKLLFFSFKKHPSFLGATFPGKICNKNFAVGVALVCNYFLVSHYFNVSKFPKYCRAWVNILLILLTL